MMIFVVFIYLPHFLVLEDSIQYIGDSRYPLRVFECLFDELFQKRSKHVVGFTYNDNSKKKKKTEKNKRESRSPPPKYTDDSESDLDDSVMFGGSSYDSDSSSPVVLSSCYSLSRLLRVPSQSSSIRQVQWFISCDHQSLHDASGPGSDASSLTSSNRYSMRHNRPVLTTCVVYVRSIIPSSFLVLQIAIQHREQLANEVESFQW